MLWWTLQQLQSKHPGTRARAAQKLGQARNVRAVEPLVTALWDKDADVRKAVAQALVQIGPAAVEPLVTALREWEEHGAVRKAAAQALVQIGPATVEPLATALQDTDAGVRKTAAQALGQLGDVRAVEPLGTALRDTDASVRKTAAWALGWLGDARAVEPLVTALRDERWWVQKAAAQALEQLGWQPGDDMQRALLATIAMTSLVAELRGESHDSHMATAQALGQLGDARAVKELVRLADTDHFPGCGKTAINALERILERNAARLASEDLQRIAQLLGVFEEHCEAYMDPDALVFRRESVDCSYVKQLARQELIRRGLLA